MHTTQHIDTTPLHETAGHSMRWPAALVPADMVKLCQMGALRLAQRASHARE